MKEDRITITRKYAIIPTFSENKQWLKKVTTYIEQSYAEKIDYYAEKLLKTKGKAEKDKIKNKLNSLYEQQCEFENNGTILQSNVNDYTYDLVRQAMKSETQRKNAIISYVFTELINRNVQEMDFKDRNKLIGELTNYGYRVKGSKKGSLFDEIDIDSPLKGYGVSFIQSLTSKIKDMINKDGVLDGKCTVFSYKIDSPFTVAKAHMGFSYDYDSFEELREHIYDKDCNLYFNFGGNGNPTIARFKFNLGSNRHKNNKQELIATMLKIYSGEYEVCGSSIGIEKNKIILNLCMSIPKKVRELDENTVVGVDLGIAIPAMCALNNDMYERESIGNKNDFLRVRTKLQAQRRRTQKSLNFTSGGHGRKKKLKALEKFKKAEAHFVETYSHMISKKVVDFALKHNAKYINIENLKGYDTSKFILRNWSYYKLQQYIKYKADRYGIIVRKINPCYTSQVCSVCGNWIEGQRESQAVFECKNENCDSHKKYKYGFNADFNAARNIAMSTLWMETGQVTEKSKQEAREYYGIVKDKKENIKVA